MVALVCLRPVPLVSGTAHLVGTRPAAIEYDWLADTPTTDPANVDFGATNVWVDNGSHKVVSAVVANTNNRHLNMNLISNTNVAGKLSNVPDSNNIDVFYLASYPSADATPRNMGFVIQGSGDSSHKNGYAIWFNGLSLVFRTWLNNTAAGDTATDFATSTNTVYGIRIQRLSYDNSFKVKIWAWGAGGMGDEPGSWLYETTDTNITTAGWCGPYAQRGGGEDDYHFISADIYGGSAPGP